MALSMEKRVQIIPTSLDYDRIGRIFEDLSPDRVYILYNKNPLDQHASINNETLDETRSIVRDRTRCYERDEVQEVGINFYRFEEALSDIYKIFYREDKQGNDIIANLSGGTKPVAIALAFACALSGIGTPVYYVAEGYEMKDNEVVSYGVADTSFKVSPLQLVNMRDVIPQDTEKAEIMISLLSAQEDLGVTEILVRRERITETPPDNEEDQSDRNKVIQRYHRHASQLFEENLLKKVGSKYDLTGTGELIANLVKVQREVDEQLTLSDFET